MKLPIQKSKGPWKKGKKGKDELKTRQKYNEYIEELKEEGLKKIPSYNEYIDYIEFKKEKIKDSKEKGNPYFGMKVGK